jgi:hypothetical protein
VIFECCKENQDRQVQVDSSPIQRLTVTRDNVSSELERLVTSGK